MQHSTLSQQVLQLPNIPIREVISLSSIYFPKPETWPEEKWARLQKLWCYSSWAQNQHHYKRVRSRGSRARTQYCFYRTVVCVSLPPARSHMLWQRLWLRSWGFLLLLQVALHSAIVAPVMAEVIGNNSLLVSSAFNITRTQTCRYWFWYQNKWRLCCCGGFCGFRISSCCQNYSRTCTVLRWLIQMQCT